jgi:ankyrin repeat protein
MSPQEEFQDALELDDVVRAEELLRAMPSLVKTSRCANLTGSTALHVAARNGFEPRALLLAKRVLELGIDLNAIDEEGNTPVHLAAESGSSSLVELLLTQGAKTEIRNRDGFTPLQVAARLASKGHTNSPAVAEVLLQGGARLDVRSAIQLGLADRLANLLQSEPAALAEVSGAESLLYDVLVTPPEVGQGRVRTMAVLLEHGVDPNSRPAHTDPPLFFAMGVEPELVPLLAAHGANVNAHNQRGESALQVAHKYADKLVTMLLRAGARE